MPLLAVATEAVTEQLSLFGSLIRLRSRNPSFTENALIISEGIKGEITPARQTQRSYASEARSTASISIHSGIPTNNSVSSDDGNVGEKKSSCRYLFGSQ